MLKPEKSLVKRAAITLTPEYLDLLADMRKEGRLGFSSNLQKIQSNFAFYVKLYEDERRIGMHLLLAFLGEEQFKEWNEALKNASEEEQQVFIDEMASANTDEGLFDEFSLPRTEEEWQAAKEATQSMPDSELKEAQKQASFFWSFFFSSFYNALSLMVHGVKLTTLVPQAIAGNEAAFLKAVQIDRMLIIHHPYFRDRKWEAQERNEKEFLRKLLTKEISSPLKSRIRYPGLYMLFGVLEAFQWLDDMRHEEILDIADEAGLDRFQNRIEDVNYLTKRLIEYRRWQKVSALSMQ